MKQKPNTSRRRRAEIGDYDTRDTSDMIDTTKPLTLKQIGIELPRVRPTQVVSILLPSTLLNQLKAYASARGRPLPGAHQAALGRIAAAPTRRLRTLAS